MSVNTGMMFDHHLFTGRSAFNEGRYFEAQQSFERIVGEAAGLDEKLIRGFCDLALGFELFFGRRMIDPAAVYLRQAATTLAEIPLSEHHGVAVRPIKDRLALWIDHLAALGRHEGQRPAAPPLPEL